MERAIGRIDPKKAILVTGAHRSGTTFLGHMLSLGRRVGYISEPFNADHGLVDIDRWFLYMGYGCNDDSRNRKLIDAFLNGEARYRKTRRTDVIGKAVRATVGSPNNLYYHWALANPLNQHYVIKDPIACMASEYLHREYGMRTVVCIRHPAAFVASLKRMNWRFDFNEFIAQDDLMRDKLSDRLAGYDLDDLSLVEEASLLWACLYGVMFEYIEANEGIIGVRHEDISRRPIEEFARLYRQLDLPLSDRIKGTIERHTSSGNRVSAREGRTHELRRDSARNVKLWKDKLTSGEIARIRDITGELAMSYYGEADW